MSQTEELNDWAFAKKCEKAVASLKKNGFTALYCQDSGEVFHYIINEAASAKSIGFGGSLSVADLKLSEKLKTMGKEILNHGLPDLTPDERLAITRRQLTCDLFLTGSNAVTLYGELVNIDGNGNRVAAMFFGPQKVIVVVGRNKLVDGSVQEAIDRIKSYASPANSKRLSLANPCASTVWSPRTTAARITARRSCGMVPKYLLIRPVLHLASSAIWARLMLWYPHRAATASAAPISTSRSCIGLRPALLISVPLKMWRNRLPIKQARPTVPAPSRARRSCWASSPHVCTQCLQIAR